MGLLEYLLLILVCGGGAFIQRITGFGMGIFAMLFLPYFLPSQGMCAAIMGLLSMFSSGYNAIRNRKSIRWKVILPLMAAAMAVIPIAVRLSATLPQAVLKRLLGVVLVVLSVYFLFFSKRVHLKPSLGNALAAGVLGGALNGLFSTGGPPIVLYLIHALPDKLAYFATVQAYFAATNLFSAVTRALNGILTGQVLILTAVALIGTFLGNTAGGAVFEKLDADRLRKVVYISMLVSGVLMVI